jgi:hypothetical protein
VFLRPSRRCGIVAALNQEADAARVCESRSSGLQAGE